MRYCAKILKVDRCITQSSGDRGLAHSLAAEMRKPAVKVHRICAGNEQFDGSQPERFHRGGREIDHRVFKFSSHQYFDAIPESRRDSSILRCAWYPHAIPRTPPDIQVTAQIAPPVK